MSFSFTDGRAVLARHETKRFSKRNLSEIKGGVFHHTAGRDNPVNTAVYHVGPNHVSETGCPALLYTFYIRMNGEIWWANDLEETTWSQGGHGSPVSGTSANTNFIAICFGGDFDSTTHQGRNIGPTFFQLHAGLALWSHLTGENNSPEIPEELFGRLRCPVEALYGHHMFGKPACPGTVLQTVVDSVRSYLPSTGSLDTDKDWQQALIDLGYDLGTYGADGVWGSVSRAALTQFQKDQIGNGTLVVDGIRGSLSEAAILQALKQ